MTVTADEGTEGGTIPIYEFASTEYGCESSAATVPSRQGIAPWDALWARSRTTRH